ncbi:hypothetical protein [Streptomyces buecherae]|uniref:hypothetical protein n=1 Tax=Streptomyces buecherae TaxID=2763006 RepID=UPI0020B8CE01|nr:hypothetical protein [Streptomyces buecherae]
MPSSSRRAKLSGAWGTGRPVADDQNGQNGCEEIPTTAGSKSGGMSWSRSSRDS